MTNLKLYLLLVLGGLTVLACSLTTPTSSESGQPSPTVEQAEQVAEAAQAVEPTTPFEPPPVPGSGMRAFATAPCHGRESPLYSWCQVDANGVYEIIKPQEGSAGSYYLDYAPSTNRVLYGSHFPNQGAGPGNIAVIDLWSLDLSSGTTSLIVEEKVIVRAAWAPNGEDLAYLRATPDSYELRWRSASGEDKLLALDASAAFSVSHAGDVVAYTRQPGVAADGLFIASVATGEERKIADVDWFAGGGINNKPGWSPDGQYITQLLLTSLGPEVQLTAADGSASRYLSYDDALPDTPTYRRLPVDLLWHPDGQHVLGTLMSGGDDIGIGMTVTIHELDAALERVIDVQVLAKRAILLGWDVPGESVWVQSFEPEPPYSVPLSAAAAPALFPAPTFDNFRVCNAPCDQAGSRELSMFPEGSTEVYVSWNNSGMQPGMRYSRHWLYGDDEQV